MKEFHTITAHGRKRVAERLGIDYIGKDKEIALLEFIYGDQFRFIWDNSIKRGVIYRTLITVIPRKEPVKPTYKKKPVSWLTAGDKSSIIG